MVVHITLQTKVVNLSTGGSATARAKVQTVSRGVVDEIVIDDAGQNIKLVIDLH